MNYRRLTLLNRYQIYAFFESGMSIRAIARKMGISPSTVSREMRRLSGTYNPVAAEALAFTKKSSRRSRKNKMVGEVEDYVRAKTKLDWSPEQIAGRRACEGLSSISYQTIYRYIARLKLQGDDLWKHLRVLKKERKERKKTNFRTLKDPRNNRVNISERPAIVEKRERQGDFERDSVLGHINEPFLLTIVDRVSRLSLIELIGKKCSYEIHQATVKALSGKTIYTITNDNSTEFAQHQATAAALEANVYFSNPYSSWERGTNENTNGLIRQYCPKKTSMKHLTPRKVRWIQDRLNNRPRKCLGYRTPNEVHESQ